MRASSCVAIFERGKFLIGGMKKFETVEKEIVSKGKEHVCR